MRHRLQWFYSYTGSRPKERRWAPTYTLHGTWYTLPYLYITVAIADHIVPKSNKLVHLLYFNGTFIVHVKSHSWPPFGQLIAMIAISWHFVRSGNDEIKRETGRKLKSSLDCPISGSSTSLSRWSRVVEAAIKPCKGPSAYSRRFLCCCRFCVGLP